MADTVHVVGLKIGDQNISLLGKASLSIMDSLFSVYNTAKLVIKDDTGIFKEQNVFYTGANLTLDLGIPAKDRVNSCEYTITDVKAEFTTSSASTTTYYLTNKMYGAQRCKSKAHTGPLS